MNKVKLTLVLIAPLLALVIGLGVLYLNLKSIGLMENLSAESMRWTIIGAIGSWIGSIFGAFALIVSLLALWLPQLVDIKASVSTGHIIGVDNINVYVVTIKNTGIRPVTIDNIYLNFGGKENGHIFIGLLNQYSLIWAYEPKFPKRIGQGEKIEYYLLKDRLDAALVRYSETSTLETPLNICVSEATKGNLYFKTKWTLGSFIR